MPLTVPDAPSRPASSHTLSEMLTGAGIAPAPPPQRRVALLHAGALGLSKMDDDVVTLTEHPLDKRDRPVVAVEVPFFVARVLRLFGLCR